MIRRLLARYPVRRAGLQACRSADVRSAGLQACRLADVRSAGLQACRLADVRSAGLQACRLADLKVCTTYTLLASLVIGGGTAAAEVVVGIAVDDAHAL